MSNTVIKIENLSKIYRLGEVGTGTLSHDLNRFVRMNILGQDDPYAKVGHVNDRTQKAEKGELVAALRDINLEVKEGEVLGIIGKNGAGKSTLLKLLSRVTSPTTGSIKVKGRLASLLEVGTGFHPEMTGRENIYMNGTIMGMRKWEIDRKLDEIVEFAGVAKYLDTPTKRYSSGMTVRLGFAIAAHLEPEILVVDEVLAVGDAEFQKKAIGKMQDVSQNQGRTVLFVSHNMASIQYLCNRALVLQNGGYLFDGDVSDGINLYLANNMAKSEKDLIDRTDRKGGYNFRFTNVNLLNERHEKINLLQAGLKCKIELEYKLLENTKIIGIRMLIVDNKGVVRILCNSGLVNQTPKIFNKTDKGKVLFSFSKFPLPEGEYSLQLSCYTEDGIGDDIEHAYSVTVEGGDFYGFGKEAVVKEGVLVNYDVEC
ncbi:ABC transporter ATP-binding protein [Carboxylicivirga sediminis]|uniref:ABC transporter ATP-binding protein n=1 Tax=Carboxylicivirga sediminis TaxID=2006564 RepID=A0A941F4E3_9BACT|nr:ABC transporter ATP-binding protein [Carboxylicivirga sediminis]MBR8535748.1 ABC transporter ATP-binding protein [Carboxylicivirga sediminis]